MLICNSYSLIIRKNILEIFKFNCINIHWSLLPKNRGPNPTQWAIIKGEDKTGLTIHYMNQNLDSGDIIYQEEVKIGIKDTWVIVNENLKKVSLKLLKAKLPNILKGKNPRLKQNNLLSIINNLSFVL